MAVKGSWVRASGKDRWELGNGDFTIVLSLDAQGEPCIEDLRLGGRNDGPSAFPAQVRAPVKPVIEVSGAPGSSGTRELRFQGARIEQAMEVSGRGGEKVRLPVLSLQFSTEGLSVTHYLCPSAEKPVLRAWTALECTGATAMDGITRFDALNLSVTLGNAQPMAAYVLGWLDGPRADAPGRPPIPFRYASWIPRLLYGDNAPPPAPPPPSWATPPLRLVKERLTKLPLRSGKRSTYDAYPWALALDTASGFGFYAGFEWSGMWKADFEHAARERAVSLFFSSDGNRHPLAPGRTLASPVAFLGLFRGDWDDGYNACRRYVREEIMPPLPKGFPDAHYGTMAVGRSGFKDEREWKEEYEAAASVGAESFLVDAGWWKEGMLQLRDDFSLGLGFFEEEPGKFPRGMRALSDAVRRAGMKYGLWFEFERVDARTANRGRNPWSPAWLLHQKGYPYRSWLPHVFLLCLGSKEASAWALENMAHALEEYRVDWLKIDGNEYAFCDDSSHGHGPAEGDWAQTQGLLKVMDGVRERFPDMIVENCAGGSQRADFAMARRSHVLQTNDIMFPSALVRRYSHGLGCMYPTSYGLMAFNPYPVFGAPTGEPLTEGTGCSKERMEWRALCRMMGTLQLNLEFFRMGEEYREVARKLIATYKKILPTLHGDRYLLAEPPDLIAPTNAEAAQWEAYEHLSIDRSLVSVFFYRCLSPDPKFRVKLRGLDPNARYVAESHTGANDGEWTGAALMEAGLSCALPQTLSADVVLLRRRA